MIQVGSEANSIRILDLRAPESIALIRRLSVLRLAAPWKGHPASQLPFIGLEGELPTLMFLDLDNFYL